MNRTFFASCLRRRARGALCTSGAVALVLAAALQGCGPANPQGPTPATPATPAPPTTPATPETPELEPEALIDPQGPAALAPEHAKAQRLLNELALSALLSGSRIDPELFEQQGNDKPELSPSARTRLPAPRVPELETALAAVNGSDRAKSSLAQGIQRAIEFCRTVHCGGLDYSVVLKAVQASSSDDEVLVLVEFTGELSAACKAQHAFSLLFLLNTPAQPPTCNKRPRLALRVNRSGAHHFETTECLPGKPVPEAATEGQCCYLEKNEKIRWGNFHEKPGGGLRCDL